MKKSIDTSAHKFRCERNGTHSTTRQENVRKGNSFYRLRVLSLGPTRIVSGTVWISCEKGRNNFDVRRIHDMVAESWRAKSCSVSTRTTKKHEHLAYACGMASLRSFLAVSRHRFVPFSRLYIFSHRHKLKMVEICSRSFYSFLFFSPFMRPSFSSIHLFILSSKLGRPSELFTLFRSLIVFYAWYMEHVKSNKCCLTAYTLPVFYHRAHSYILCSILPQIDTLNRFVAFARTDRDAKCEQRKNAFFKCHLQIWRTYTWVFDCVSAYHWHPRC